MKKLIVSLFFLLSFTAFSDSMAVFVNGAGSDALKPSATNAVLATAKSYTDTQISAIPAAHDFGPDINTASNAVLTSAKYFAEDQRDYAKAYSNTNTLVRAKDYTDAKASNYLLKTGGTMSGAINMGSKKITSLATPSSNTDAATKKYADDVASSAQNAALANAKNYSDTNTLVRAKSYADTTASSAESNAKSWARSATNAVLISAKAYTVDYFGTNIQTFQSAAAADATTKANSALANAKKYSDTNTLVRAKSYADNVSLTAATTAANTAEGKAKTYADGVGTSTLNSAKTWARGATNAVLIAAQLYADSAASSAQSAATSAAATDATTKVNTLKTEAYDFAKNLKIKMGTGSDAPKTAGNATAYSLADSRDKVALTNVASGASLSLLVDVVSPPDTPVTATVKAGNSRYCTVNFPNSSLLAGKTVLFNLVVTAVNTANSASPAVTKVFYITHTFPVL